jgi:hypothetical protein
MRSNASTVDEYLRSLPADRRAAVSAVRDVILENLNDGFQERMSYGMIGYCVPHSLYPAGHHCDPKMPLPFAGLASQKQHMSLYLMSNYSRRDFWKWFEGAWKKSGKRLDMGKACIRFKKLDDLPLDVIGEAFRRITVADHIADYEAIMAQLKKKPPAQRVAEEKSPAKAAKRSAAGRAAAKSKPAARKSAKKTQRKADPRR